MNFGGGVVESASLGSLSGSSDVRLHIQVVRDLMSATKVPEFDMTRIFKTMLFGRKFTSIGLGA